MELPNDGIVWVCNCIGVSEEPPEMCDEYRNGLCEYMLKPCNARKATIQWAESEI